MSTQTVRADWIRDQVFLLSDHLGFPIIMTQPQGVKGSDLLPLSVIGCTLWDIAAILQKQRQQVTALEVTADSTQDDDPPWRFRKIHIRYRITGRHLDREAVERAISLSEEKYCSTLATLRAAVEISSDYEIVEAGQPGAGDG